MNNLFNFGNFEVIELFEIKLSDTEGYFRFHGSKNFTKDVIFQGRVYAFIPCEITGIEYKTDGKNARPKLSVGNPNNFFSNLIKDRNNLLGYKIYRKKILTRDLDDSNFNTIGLEVQNPIGNVNFKDYLSVDFFIIHKKNAENKEKIEFELTSPLDIEGAVVPKRKIFNDTCPFMYRGCGCKYGSLDGYNGPVVPKYNSDYTPNGTISSVEIFANYYSTPVSQTANLGVPVSDEFDKTFISGNYSQVSNNSSYGLTGMTYRGDFNIYSNYSKGDFVKIESSLSFDFDQKGQFFKNDSPPSFHVLISGTSVGKDPRLNTDVWIEDKCSRKLSSCLLRYRDGAKQNPSIAIPYGGFPGTVNFEYDLPKS